MWRPCPSSSNSRFLLFLPGWTKPQLSLWPLPPVPPLGSPCSGPPRLSQTHFETCVMQPQPASSPMDLCFNQPAPPGLPPVEDISPPPESHRASALTSLEEFQVGPDPFEGSALSGFGLPPKAHMHKTGFYIKESTHLVDCTWSTQPQCA